MKSSFKKNIYKKSQELNNQLAKHVNVQDATVYTKTVLDGEQ